MIKKKSKVVYWHLQRRYLSEDDMEWSWATYKVEKVVFYVKIEKS